MKYDKTLLRITGGLTRHVILMGNIAIKIPHLRNGSYLFLTGAIANLNEADRWQASKHQNLARVIWRAPLGLVLIVRRYRYYVDDFIMLDALPFDSCDNKVGAFAIEDGVLKLLDYGDSSFGFKDFWIGKKD